MASPCIASCGCRRGAGPAASIGSTRQWPRRHAGGRRNFASYISSGSGQSAATHLYRISLQSLRLQNGNAVLERELRNTYRRPFGHVEVPEHPAERIDQQ